VVLQPWILFYIVWEEMMGLCVLPPENVLVQDVIPGNPSPTCTAEDQPMKYVRSIVSFMLLGGMMDRQVSTLWSGMTPTVTSGFLSQRWPPEDPL